MSAQDGRQSEDGRTNPFEGLSNAMSDTEFASQDVD